MLHFRKHTIKKKIKQIKQLLRRQDIKENTAKFHETNKHIHIKQ